MHQQRLQRPLRDQRFFGRTHEEERYLRAWAQMYRPHRYARVVELTIAAHNLTRRWPTQYNEEKFDRIHRELDRIYDELERAQRFLRR